MTITAAPPEQREAPAPAPLTSGHLPTLAVWSLLAGSLAAMLIVFWIMSLGDGGGINLAGWLVSSGLLYLVLVFTISAIVESRRKAVDRLVTGVVTAAFLIAMVPLVSVAWTVVVNGINRFDAMFFSSSMRNVVGEGGGALHAIVGTILITGAAAIISIPIGLMAAVYLVEYGEGKRLAKGITFLVDVMTGIPSIVAGLFAYAVFALIFGPGIRMGIMGSIALSVLMIPVVVRSTEEMLRLVPNELREASYALGVPKWRTIVKVVLPTSLAGITTGIMLSISRVIGETAPLLITVGFTNSMNYDLFSGRMQTLPGFHLHRVREPGNDPPRRIPDRAWAGALTLILIVMVLNLVARLVARLFSPKTGR